MSIYIRRNQEEYNENFRAIIVKYSEPKYLTIKGFNSISNISAKSYTIVFKTNWYDLLKKYGEFDRLYQYAKDEFIKSGITSLINFIKIHDYLTEDFSRYIDGKLFKSECNISKKYTKEILNNNFNQIKLQLGRIPNHSEFIKISKIHPKTYQQFFKLSEQVWEDIIRIFVSEEEINEFNEYQSNYRKQITSINSQKEYIYSNEELEQELKNVFDYYYKEFGIYPSKRLFNDLLYRERFYMKWSEVCEMYGYKINNNNNKAEKICLQLIDNILMCKHESQKKI